MKYLFVCSQNRIRSRLIALYFRKILEQENLEAVVESAGTSESAVRRLTKEMVEEADVIVAVDDSIYREIQKEYSPPPGKLFNLDILDIYDYSGEVWEELLESECISRGKDILQRVEVMDKLSLEMVLTMKWPVVSELISLCATK